MSNSQRRNRGADYPGPGSRDPTRKRDETSARLACSFAYDLVRARSRQPVTPVLIKRVSAHDTLPPASETVLRRSYRRTWICYLFIRPFYRYRKTVFDDQLFSGEFRGLTKSDRESGSHVEVHASIATILIIDVGRRCTLVTNACPKFLPSASKIKGYIRKKKKRCSRLSTKCPKHFPSVLTVNRLPLLMLSMGSFAMGDPVGLFCNFLIKKKKEKKSSKVTKETHRRLGPTL